MGGLFTSLNIGKSSLIFNQTGIGVTGHNIANAGNPVYSRQRVEMSTVKPLNTAYGQLGQGVTITETTRARDLFLDKRVRNDLSSFSYWEDLSTSLEEVEGLYNEGTDFAISTVLGDFFNAWQELSLNPDDMPTRADLLDKSRTLAESFNNLDSNLQEIKDRAYSEIEKLVHDINNYAVQIAELNSQISGSEHDGAKANDLRDNRDAIVDKLSELVNVNVTETGNSSYLVRIGGMVLVEMGDSVELQVKTQPGEQGMAGISVVWAGNQRELELDGGSLKSRLDLAGTMIPQIMEMNNGITQTLIDRVNAIHAESFGLDGSSGMEFFTGSSAANIAVNPSLLTNPEKIAASGTGSSGDNSSALAIYRISQVKIMGNESYTVDEYYNAMTTEIASTTERSNNERDTASLLKEQSQNQREASKGVSIDEELLDMVKYQAAYGASAKLVETVNGLIETLIASV